MGFLDLIFPPRCPGCECYLTYRRPPGDPDEDRRNDDRGCCPICRQGIFIIHGPGCPRCGLPRKGFIGKNAPGVDDLCGECLKEPPKFLSACAFWEYDALIAEMLQRSKYGADMGRLGQLARMLRPFFTTRLESLAGKDRTLSVVPIPMHPRDLRRRGFNMAYLLAKTSLRRTGFKIRDDILFKTRQTSPQASLSRLERRMNLKNAFTAKAPRDRQRDTVILFDDVMTTGTTAREAARSLKKAGWKDIHLISAARTL